MTTRPSVLYYCQHSVGLGHLVRSLAIAHALSEGFRVVVASGGAVPPELAVPPGVELVALPAIGSSDGRGSHLISLETGLDLEEVWRRRQNVLETLLDEVRPVALVIELFPFGRRKFARELVPFLERAASLDPAPVTVSSVRDILVDSKYNQRELDDRAALHLNRYFDAIIVHADPNFATLDETFRPSIPVKPSIHYSGFVVRSAHRPPRLRPSAPEVLISAGGGKVGESLFRAAVTAHRRYLDPLGVRTRVVTGPFLDALIVEQLEADARGCATLEISKFEPHLCEAMASASVTVSQCGYNTALDIIRAGVPALVVPYDADGETEQAFRATRLARKGVVKSLSMDDLTPETLSGAIIGTLSMRTPTVTFDLGGSTETARIVHDLVEQRTRRVLSLR
ncbi:MAG: glycosyl transferase [Acidobacteria bacterium]|nr:glycosyl transferase [Acidobacteriota bacterium]